MIDLTDLPRMIMPATLAEHVEEALKDVTPPPGATADRVSAHVHGPGGGQWHIGVRDGVFDLASGVCEAPLMTMSLSVSDWREFVAGRVRDTMLQHVKRSMLDLAALSNIQGSSERATRVRALEGAIHFVVQDKEEDAEYGVTLTFGTSEGGKASATTTVSVDLDYLGHLVSGQETPQNAFFAGKIRIEGDMNLAMALMSAMM